MRILSRRGLLVPTLLVLTGASPAQTQTDGHNRTFQLTETRVLIAGDETDISIDRHLRASMSRSGAIAVAEVRGAYVGVLEEGRPLRGSAVREVVPVSSREARISAGWETPSGLRTGA